MPPDFILRPWHVNDLPDLVEIADNAHIARFMTDKFPHPYTQEHAKNFIEFANADDPVHIFAIDIGGKASGGIGIHPQGDIYAKNAELGYWLGEPFWNRGIMSAAINEIIKFGFQTFNISRIFARPFGSNTASQKVLEKSGFVLEARIDKVLFKNGHYEDELIYAVRREGQ